MRKGVAYLTLANVVFMASGYATNLFLARLLGPSSYGVYGLLTAIMTALNLMQVNGVPQAVSNYIASNKKMADAIFYSGLIVQILLTTILTLLLFMLAPVVAQIFNIENGTHYIRLVALIFPLYSIFSLYIGFYNGLQNFTRQANMYSLYAIAKLVFIILLAIKFQLTGVIVGFIIAPILPILYGLRLHKPESSFPKRMILSYSMPLMVFATISILLFSIDLFTLKAMVSDLRVIGYYSAAQSIALIPFLAVNSIGQVMFPTIARLVAEGAYDSAAEAVSNAWKYMWLILVPMLGIIFGLAHNVVSLLFGVEYVAATDTLRILIFGYLLLSIFSLFSSVLNGIGKLRSSIGCALGGAVVTIAACLILIPQFGASGAAIATTLGGLFAAIAAMIQVRGIIKFRFQFQTLVKAILIGGAIGALALTIPLPVWILPIWATVLFLLYLGVLLILGILPKAELLTMYDNTKSKILIRKNGRS